MKEKLKKNNVKLNDVKTKTNLKYKRLSSENHVLKTIFNVLEPFINLLKLFVSLCNVDQCAEGYRTKFARPRTFSHFEGINIYYCVQEGLYYPMIAIECARIKRVS